MLTRLIYSSTATSPITLKMSTSLIQAAIVNNRAANITGMLCCSRHHFLQVLEGERLAVGRLLHRIWDDPRHEDVCLLSVSDVQEREFPTWEMGYAGLSPKTQPIVERYFPDLKIDGTGIAGDSALALLRELRPHLADQTGQLLMMNDRSA